MDLKAIWKRHYACAPRQLERVKAVRGVVSVFNANIDAVLKVQPATLRAWMAQLEVDEARLLDLGDKRVDAPADVLRGFVACFREGIAQEWLVSSAETFAWMREHLGYDRLQMGGQGGIIANVMTVIGAQNVYVHCASLPAQQAGLFLDAPRLQSSAADGRLHPARAIDRAGDLPLIHWILEFDKGAALTVAGQTLICPKSNRFIVTYDPLNFELTVDPAFDAAMRAPEQPVDVILVSGYQLLSEPLSGQPAGSGLQRISESWGQVQAWKAAHPDALVHFELASTQDLKIRQALAEGLAPHADSVGCNEQEVIDVLAVIDEGALAREATRLDSVSLFKGLLKIFQKLKLRRLQLHMLGLYITLLRPDTGGRLAFQPQANRDGMVFAATLAAAKAGTGTLEDPADLLWAVGHPVADHSLKELSALAAHVEAAHGIARLAESGMGACAEFAIVAVPTIIIDKPVTLVGMGDTISSLSLVGAR